jgi:phenylacetate-CoA ligase
MPDPIYRDVARAYAAAAERAPGLKARFSAAGFDPSAVAGLDDLSRLPVLKKEESAGAAARRPAVRRVPCCRPG